ncbi:MAG: hypothetical protein O7G83_09690, partial [Proteobacteria bacterium]|nr:hypothetical protein [Pseudomonadota bacterium]
MARPHRRGLGEALETDPRAAGFDGAGSGGAGLRDGLADRGVYLDRAAPRLALAKFLALAFTFRPFIEPGPGSTIPAIPSGRDGRRWRLAFWPSGSLSPLPVDGPWLWSCLLRPSTLQWIESTRWFVDGARAHR